MTDVRRPRMSRCAGVMALAAMLSVAAREPGHGAGTPGRAPFAERLAEADPGGDSWFRIGDLMNAVTTNMHEDHTDRTRDAGEPDAEHVGTPSEEDAPSLNLRDDGR